ncbi:MAG: EAL domain-containing protein, partial [Lachnospiraceae bacterium]|nr:EAL domain-containing protein [Lachnospiraceae bacterium]
MQALYSFHIAFYAAAITICVTVLLFTFLQKRTDRLQNKIFIMMMLILLANAISTTGSAITEPKAASSSVAHFVMQFCQFFYFFFHTALCPALYYYVLSVTGVIRKRSFLKNFAVGIPLYITEIFVLLNPIFHHVYYYDSNIVFHRNWAEYLIYGVAGLYFILSAFELIFSWKAITKRRGIAIIYFYFLSLAGVIIQLLYINIKAELFAESIALMGVMLAVESEDDRLDADTNIYNRKALQLDIHNFNAVKEHISIFFIKITNADIVERATGSSNDDLMAIAISDFLKTLVPRYNLYNPNSATYIVACPGFDEEELDELNACIEERFKDNWDIANASIKLDAVIIKASIPEDLKSPADVLFVADSVIPSSVNKEDVDLNYILHRAEIERAIKRNLRENNFEVYYQPTYDLIGPMLHGAEALVRMIDDSIGFISPEEFIPVAEQIGLVEEIDDFVLKEVCGFIQGGIPKAHGMDAINVNLSVVQCLKPGFFEHIIRIVDNYGVDHSMINFEITESVEADDYKVLSTVAKSLKSAGFKLSMDDYGTGYSNMESIFALDFDIV